MGDKGTERTFKPVERRQLGLESKERRSGVLRESGLKGWLRRFAQ